MSSDAGNPDQNPDGPLPAEAEAPDSRVLDAAPPQQQGQVNNNNNMQVNLNPEALSNLSQQLTNFSNTHSGTNSQLRGMLDKMNKLVGEMQANFQPQPEQSAQQPAQQNPAGQGNFSQTTTSPDGRTQTTTNNSFGGNVPPEQAAAFMQQMNAQMRGMQNMMQDRQGQQQNPQFMKDFNNLRNAFQQMNPAMNPQMPPQNPHRGADRGMNAGQEPSNEYSNDMPTFLNAQGDKILRGIFEKYKYKDPSELSAAVTAAIKKMPLDPGPRPADLPEGDPKLARWKEEKAAFDKADKSLGTREKVPGNMFEKDTDENGKKRYKLNPEEIENNLKGAKRNMYFERDDGKIDIAVIDEDGKVSSYWKADPVENAALDTSNLKDAKQLKGMPGPAGALSPADSGQGQNLAAEQAAAEQRPGLKPGENPDGAGGDPTGRDPAARAQERGSAASPAYGSGADGEARNVGPEAGEVPGRVFATNTPDEVLKDLEDKAEARRALLEQLDKEKGKGAADKERGPGEEQERKPGPEADKDTPGDDDKNPLDDLSKPVEGVKSSLAPGNTPEELAKEEAQNAHDRDQSPQANPADNGGPAPDAQVFEAGMPGSEDANKKLAEEQKAASNNANNDLRSIEDGNQAENARVIPAEGITDANRVAAHNPEGADMNTSQVTDGPEATPTLRAPTEPAREASSAPSPEPEQQAPPTPTPSGTEVEPGQGADVSQFKNIPVVGADGEMTYEPANPTVADQATEVAEGATAEKPTPTAAPDQTLALEKDKSVAQEATEDRSASPVEKDFPTSPPPAPPLPTQGKNTGKASGPPPAAKEPPKQGKPEKGWKR